MTTLLALTIITGIAVIGMQRWRIQIPGKGWYCHRAELRQRGLQQRQAKFVL